MSTISNLVFAAALLCAVPAFAAEPVLLADTNTNPARDIVGTATSIGEFVVFDAGAFSGAHVWSWNGSEYAELLEARNVTLYGADGLAVVTTIDSTFITDGTVEGTHEIGGERTIREVSRVGDRWLFWDLAVDAPTLWSVTADGELTEVGRSLHSGVLAVRDELAFFADENCALRSTDGTASSPVLSLPGAGELGRISECIVTPFGDELAVLQLGDTKIWVTEGGVTSARELTWIDQADWITHGAGGLFYNAGPDLWFTDGTPEGTLKLHTFPNYVGLERVLSQDDRLVFQWNNEIWTSDGTVAGTVDAGGSRAALEVVFRRDEAFWFAEDGAIWAIGTGAPAKIVEPPAEPFRLQISRTGLGLVVYGASEVWSADASRTDWNSIWPNPASERTESGSPQNFLALESVALFLSNGPEEEEPPQTFWITDGTPEGTSETTQIPSNSHFVTRLAGDRALGFGYDEGYFIYDAANGVTNVEDARTLDVPTEELTRFDTTRSGEDVYIFDVWFSPTDAVGYISRLVDDRLELFAQIDVLPPDGVFEPITVFVDETGRLVATTPSCRTWVFDDLGVSTFSQPEPCRTAPNLTLANGELEVRRDGVWLVSETPPARISEDSSSDRLFVIGGEAFFLRTVVLDGENPVTELAATDGTVENTRSVFLPEFGVDERAITSSNDRIYLRVFEPDRLLELSPDGTVVTLTPTAGNGASPSMHFAILPDRAIYTGTHEIYGREPFAVALDGTNAGGDPSGDAPNNEGESLSGGGCGCAASGGQLPFGTLALLALFGLIRRLRISSSDAP